METINVNGTEYVKRSEIEYAGSDHVCVIADRGWIFEGRRVPCDGDNVRLADASVVRKWSNGLGIGGLAKAEHKDGYTLDHIGGIEVVARAVIAIIPLEW